MKRRLLCGCNCSANNYAFWFYIWQILEEKRVARLILSLDLSHKLAAGVATHWFVALVRVITIHHLDWLNTSLWPEGRPQGGAFASPPTLIHKINWAHAHLSKHVEYIHVNRRQTKVAGRRSFFRRGGDLRFQVRTRAAAFLQAMLLNSFGYKKTPQNKMEEFLSNFKCFFLQNYQKSHHSCRERKRNSNQTDDWAGQRVVASLTVPSLQRQMFLHIIVIFWFIGAVINQRQRAKHIIVTVKLKQVITILSTQVLREFN